MDHDDGDDDDESPNSKIFCCYMKWIILIDEMNYSQQLNHPKYESDIFQNKMMMIEKRIQ